MADWYTAAQVTATNGSAIVVVNSGEAVNAIREGDGLRISGFEEVEILDAFTDGTTGNEVIRLKSNWIDTTQTLVAATVIPHAVHFNIAADALTTTNNKIASNFAPLMAFGSQASGTVTFTAISELDQDVTIRSIPQYKTDLDALESQVTGSVADVNTIDTQVNGVGGLVEVVGGIDATLQGYVASADNDATKAQEYAVNPYGTVVTGTSDYSSLHHATDSNDAKVIAVQAKDDTVNLKTDVETLKSDTTTIYNNTFALATTAEDVEISTGVYSTLHYAAKAQASATAAQGAAASVTSALYFVGGWDASGNTAPPAPTGSGNPFYKITVAGTFAGNDYTINDNTIWDSVNTTWLKVDNTEQVVSVNGKQGIVDIVIADIAGLQGNLDSKVNTTTTINSQPLNSNVTLAKGDVGLGDVDNTSDLDKPISTAVNVALGDKANVTFTDDLQLQINKVRKLALAGL